MSYVWEVEITSLDQRDFEKLDASIRQGRMNEVRDSIGKISLKELNRAARYRYAHLCRRTGLPLLGLQALRPFVRPSETSPQKATLKEKLEYAACLNWLGLLNEAANLLAEIPLQEEPFAGVIHAFVHFSQWNYEAALCKLESAMGSPQLRGYERAIAEANLLSALVHLRKYAQAEKLAFRLKKEFQAERLDNLHLSIVKQELEMAIDQGDWLLASSLLQELRGKSAMGDPFSQLFLEKWEMLYYLYRGSKKKEWEPRLEKVKQKAVALGHGETLRDCDYHIAVVNKDLELAQKVYFGTPQAPYRQRFLRDASWLGEHLPKIYFIPRGKILTTKPKDVFDPIKERFWRADGVLDKVFVTLTADLYRNPTLLSIFDQAFSGYFHKEHSPNLVHQAMHRLKAQIKQSKKDLSVKEEKSQYRLDGTCAVPLRENGLESDEGRKFERFFAKYRGNRFSAMELATDQGVTIRTAQRILQPMLLEGKLICIRDGKKKFYFLGGNK